MEGRGESLGHQLQGRKASWREEKSVFSSPPNDPHPQDRTCLFQFHPWGPPRSYFNMKAPPNKRRFSEGSAKVLIIVFAS